MMTKRTLDRLADPMKGRYESPPKERKKTQKFPALPDAAQRSNRRSLPNEKVERTKEREARSEDRRPIPPIRYHSPIREDSPDENSCEEYSPRKGNRAVERKDSDSFFLTGTMHGEVDIQRSSYHPVMDVRINLDGHHRQSATEDVYTSRTKEYLQEALQRSQTGHGGGERGRYDGTSPTGKQKKTTALVNEQRSFVKEIDSKKSKTKSKADSSKRDQRVSNGIKKKKSEGTKAAAPGERSRRSNLKKESLLPSQKREMSRWGGSRDPLPANKNVIRKLMAPVAGIQTKKTSKKSKKAAPDNLVGLERVDEGPMRDGNLLRTNSSSTSTRRTPLSRAPPPKSISSGGSNLIGSRSAPTLSRRKVMGSTDGAEGLAQIEETLPAYRVHAPMPSRLLAKGPPRRPPLPGSNKSAVRLAPLDAPFLGPEASSHSDAPSNTSTVAEKSKTSLRRSSSSSSDFTIGSNTLGGGASSSLSIPSKTRLSVGSTSGASDDQLAALFSQHAKKLSQNLEKASNLSMQFQHMKDYDGMTASSRHIDSGSLLPTKRASGQQEGSGREETAPAFVPPERLSMII